MAVDAQRRARDQGHEILPALRVERLGRVGLDDLRVDHLIGEHLAEDLDVRHPNGWGPETGLLLVSGGSHAGNATGAPRGSRFTPGRRVHLIPLEPIAADAHTTFAVVPPWLKEVWRDPEAEGTG